MWSISALLMMFVLLALPIAIVMRITRYVRESGEERRRLRMEVSKLAEEVSLMRQQQSKD